jgi:regulatory protein
LPGQFDDPTVTVSSAPADDRGGGSEARLQRALELAYRHLGPRDRTTSEVRLHLRRKGIDETTIDAAVGRLHELGYLDDPRYARAFTQDKRELEDWGVDRIRRTLLERGIDRDLVASTLDGDLHRDELDRALALLRRRFPEPPRERRERDRALGVLVRKGYDMELALDALSAYARDQR